MMVDGRKEKCTEMQYSQIVTELTRKEDVKLASNLIICCESCNREKGNRYTYEEFLAIKQK